MVAPMLLFFGCPLGGKARSFFFLSLMSLKGGLALCFQSLSLSLLLLCSMMCSQATMSGICKFNSHTLSYDYTTAALSEPCTQPAMAPSLKQF